MVKAMGSLTLIQTRSQIRDAHLPHQQSALDRVIGVFISLDNSQVAPKKSLSLFQKSLET